jgi:hypothetical protein
MTLNETKEWMDDLWNLLIDINICRNNSMRITKSVYDNEDSIKKQGFFCHYLFQLKFILGIQICKILQDNENQKRNINKLLRRLECESWDIELAKAVEANRFVQNPGRASVIKEVMDIKDKIATKTELIESIIKVRNQNYAHFDPTRDKTGPSVKKYAEAVVLASDVYNRLSFIMFRTSTPFEHTKDWEIDPILRSLSKELTDWLEERKRKYGS